MENEVGIEVDLQGREYMKVLKGISVKCAYNTDSQGKAQESIGSRDWRHTAEFVTKLVHCLPLKANNSFNWLALASFFYGSDFINVTSYRFN